MLNAITGLKELAAVTLTMIKDPGGTPALNPKSTIITIQRIISDSAKPKA